MTFGCPWGGGSKTDTLSFGTSKTRTWPPGPQRGHVGSESGCVAITDPPMDTLKQ
jgi:hypothetical protein